MTMISREHDLYQLILRGLNLVRLFDFLFANRFRIPYVRFLTNSKVEKCSELVPLILLLPYPLSLSPPVRWACNNKAGP